MEKPFVSVVIPSYNSEDYISQCLHQILDQSYPTDQYEVIVVDNASTDRSPEIIKTFPVQYLFEPRQGPAAARNTGIRAAIGDYILFIDTDCMAERDLIRLHMEAHWQLRQRDETIKVVGGGIGGINKSYWALCDDFCSWYQNHPRLRPRLEESYLPTANLSVAREVLETADGFDETFRFGEDYMFCQKVRDAGYRIYFEPRAVVYHINRASFAQFMKHAREWAQLSKYIPPQTLKHQTIALKNPVLTMLCSSYFFMLRFLQLCHSWLSTGRLSFLLGFPGVLANRLYFGFHMAKSRYMEG
jgi:glycosyltransferase involved in cell wall biosynthesis